MAAFYTFDAASGKLITEKIYYRRCQEKELVTSAVALLG